jgi:hypothetical protein
MKLYKNRCVSTCPNGYREGENNTCVKCPNGCETCDKSGACNACTIGYYFIRTEKRCVIHCPKGYFNECSKKECAKCNDACSECVGPSAKECISCANNYYKDDKTCVKPEQCRISTFADKETKECVNCNLPYCAACSDKFTCKQCVRGFVIENNKCVVAKTFTNVIKGIQVFDHFTFTNRRDREIIHVNKIGGTGVSSPVVSFNFWIKLLSPLRRNNKLVTIKSTTVNTFDYVLRVNTKSNKCELQVVNRTGIEVQVITLADCSYEKLYNWKFFDISIKDNKDSFKVDVTIGKYKVDKSAPQFKKFTAMITQLNGVNEIIEKDTKIIFNDNDKEDILALGVYNFNILDYQPIGADFEKFSNITPSSCDYFCTDCANSCKKCNDGLPNKDGYCPAKALSIINGVKIINKDTKIVKYDLKLNSSKVFDSSRYAFATWFYLNKKADTKKGFSLFNDYYLETQNNNVVTIKDGKIVINNETEIEFKETIEQEQWYFIAVGYSRKTYKVWVFNQKGQEVLKKTYSKTKTTKFVRVWNSWEFNFKVDSGAILNSVVYINNIPEDIEIDKQVKNFKLPNFCAKVGRSLNCKQCIAGYRLNELKKCVLDIKLDGPKAIKRIDLWDSETVNTGATTEMASDEYSLSIWFRKKTHSYLPNNVISKKDMPKFNKDNTYNLLGLTTKTGEVTSIVSITNKDKFESDLKFAPKGAKRQFTVTHKFDSEVYDYIHVGITFRKTQKTLTYEVEDFSTKKTYSQVVEVDEQFFSTQYTGFIIGDKTGFEINMEVSWLQIFNAAIAENSLKKIREAAPKECDAACKTTCDLETGICAECANGLKNSKVCPTFLLGYTVSYLYSHNNKEYKSLQNISQYLNRLKKAGFTWGVNSKLYSFLGYFKVFDFNAAKNKKDARYRLVSIGNRRKLKFTTDAGQDIVSLDLNIENEKATLEWVLNGSGKKITKSVKNLTVTPEQWFAFHAGIDVKNKKFTYKIVQMNGLVTFAGEEYFIDYPEILQQIGGISLLGVRDNIDHNNYLLPSVRLHQTYLIPNSGFSEDLLTKFLTKFKLPEDVQCPKNCSRCLMDKSGKVECLHCKQGYAFENGNCVQTKGLGEANLLVLSDNKVITVPTKFEIKSTAQNIFNGDSTLSFFIRRNYFSGANRQVLTYGKITGFVTKDNSLNDYFNIKVAGTELSLTAKLGEAYEWYSISISITETKIELTVAGQKSPEDKTQVEKALTSKTRLTPTAELSVDPNNNEYQIFGVHIVAEEIDRPSLSFPKVDCSIDCLFCQENTCKSCAYGFDKSNKCETKNIQYNNEITQVSLPVKKLLASKLALRSSTYTAAFSFQTQLTGVIDLFKLNNSAEVENASNPSEHLFLKYNPATYSFYLGYTTRQLIAKSQSAEVREVKYTSKPKKLEHFVAIAVDNDIIRYIIFNTHENYIKGEIKLSGKMDYVTLDTNLHFFSKKHAKGQDSLGFIQNIRFYYEQALSFDSMVSKATLYSDMVQPDCKLGTKYNCKECSTGIINNGLCQPNDSSVTLINEEVAPISRNQVNGKQWKYEFKKDATSFQSFSLSFWWRPTALLSANQNILNAKISTIVSDTAATIPAPQEVYSLTFTPKNTLMIGYPVSSDKKLKAVHVVPDLFKTEELFRWVYIRINVDFTKRTHTISITHEETKRNIVKEDTIEDIAIPNTGYALTSNIMNIYAGYPDTTLDCTDNVSFELSYMSFMPNYLLIGEAAKIFKPVQPNLFFKPCMKPRVNMVCQEKDRLRTPINIGDITSGVEVIKSNDPKDLSYLDNIPMFRPLYLDPPYAQSFLFFQISFTLDVNAYLSSAYSANKDVLFVIHSNNKPDFETMSMNQAIPDSLARLGSLSLVNNKGVLTIYNGYVPWSNTVSSFEIPLGGKSLSAFSKIYFSILFDNIKRSTRLVVMADDLLFNLDVTKNSFAAPITFNSLVFSHPVLNKLNLNLYNPRLVKDISENAQSQMKTVFKENTCEFADKNCKTCLLKENSKESYCLACKDGFVFYEGKCRDGYFVPPKPMH